MKITQKKQNCAIILVYYLRSKKYTSILNFSITSKICTLKFNFWRTLYNYSLPSFDYSYPAFVGTVQQVGTLNESNQCLLRFSFDRMARASRISKLSIWKFMILKMNFTSAYFTRLTGSKRFCKEKGIIIWVLWNDQIRSG